MMPVSTTRSIAVSMLPCSAKVARAHPVILSNSFTGSCLLRATPKKQARAVRSEVEDRSRTSIGASCSYDPRKKNGWDGARGRSSWQEDIMFTRAEAQRQQDFIRQQIQQQMQERPPWQTMLLPALGIGFLTLLFGPVLFGLMVAGVAIGAAFTVSAASLLFFLPLVGGAVMLGGLGFGLSAGAFVLTGIVASAFNLLLVAGGLAAGFSITRRLLKAARGDTGTAASSRPGTSAAASQGSRTREVDIEAEVKDADEDDMAKMNEEEMRRFDELLREREKLRQVDLGTRWKP